MKIFRFKIEWYCEDENKVLKDFGFAPGENYGKAAETIESMYTDSKGRCSLISLNLYEVDSFKGIIYDEDITDIFRAEKNTVRTKNEEE